MKDLQVSVLCTVFNHEKYLRRCLDGFVMQKTSFNFEVLVHDDCSSDGSRQIIEYYANKYPHIIKPIYQQENKYSQGISIIDDILIPLAQGKYFAFCEGDDYWCDEKKLQKQYNYMKEHVNCSMCVHNTIIHDLSLKNKDTLFNKKKNKENLSEEDVFLCWNVHTSSYFIKREYGILPKELVHFWFRDYVRLTYAFINGEIGYLPDKMSVYNKNNTDGATVRYLDSEIEKKIKMTLSRGQYLEALTKITGYKSLALEKRIRLIKYDSLKIKNSFLIKKSNSKKESIKLAKEVGNNPEFKEFIRSIGFVDGLKFFVKYKGYLLYPIWIKLWKTNKFN